MECATIIRTRLLTSDFRIHPLYNDNDANNNNNDNNSLFRSDAAANSNVILVLLLCVSAHVILLIHQRQRLSIEGKSQRKKGGEIPFENGKIIREDLSAW